MSNRKYLDEAPLVGPMSEDDVSLISRDGDGTYYYYQSQLADYIISALGAAPHDLYVASNGNDLSGDGSFYKPYATGYKAMFECDGITQTNIFILGNPTFDTLPIPVKPQTSIVSFSSEVSTSLDLSLDNTSWTANPGGNFILKNISIRSVSFDFSFLTSRNPKLKFSSVSMESIDIECGDNNIELQHIGCTFSSTCAIYNVFSSFRSIGNYYRGNFNIGKTTALARNTVAALNSNGDIFDGDVNLKAPNAGGQLQGQYKILNASRNKAAALTAEGTNLFIDIDSATLAGGSISIVAGTPTITYTDSAPRRFVFPNYTTTQRNALVGVVQGDTIFNTSVLLVQTWNGTIWI